MSQPWWTPPPRLSTRAEVEGWLSAMREVEALGPIEGEPVPRSRWGWRSYAEAARAYGLGPTVVPGLYRPEDVAEARAHL